MRLVIGVVTALLISSCSTSNVTVGDVEPATTSALQAAIETAATQLMARESIPMAVLYYVATEPERVIRYEWIDFRRDGGALVVYRDLERDTTEGLSFDGGTWLTASHGRPWQQAPSSAPSAEQIATIALVDGLSHGDIDIPTDPTATQQSASDGSVLWTVTGADDDTIREWIINKDGTLQFYRVTNLDGLDGGATKIVYEFGVTEQEPAPLIVPDAGTPLEIADLGVPRALTGLKVIE